MGRPRTRRRHQDLNALDGSFLSYVSKGSRVTALASCILIRRGVRITARTTTPSNALLKHRHHSIRSRGNPRRSLQGIQKKRAPLVLPCCLMLGKQCAAWLFPILQWHQRHHECSRQPDGQSSSDPPHAMALQSVTAKQRTGGAGDRQFFQPRGQAQLWLGTSPERPQPAPAALGPEVGE